MIKGYRFVRSHVRNLSTDSQNDNYSLRLYIYTLKHHDYSLRFHGHPFEFYPDSKYDDHSLGRYGHY